jgi:hypothetical protein
VFPLNTTSKVHHTQEAPFTMLGFVWNVVKCHRLEKHSKTRDNTIGLLNRVYYWIHL